MRPPCAFCGRDPASCDGDTPIHRSRLSYHIGICIYCCRAAIRAFGEIPDASDGVIDLGERRRRLAASD